MIPASRGAIGRQNNFDLLRLFAASQVVFFHAAHNMGIPLDGPLLTVLASLLAPFPGVPIFFVISGFLISAAFERNPNLFQYLRNRALRIFPGLWVCTAVTLLVLLLCRGASAMPPPDLSVLAPALAKWLAAQLTIAQFYCPFPLKYYGSGHLNGSLWTIPVELQFYLVLPLMVALYTGRTRLRQNLHLAALMIVCLAVTAAFLATNDRMTAWNENVAVFTRVTVFPYLYMFLCGVLIQANFGTLRRFLEGRALWWAIAYAAYCLIATTTFGAPLSTNTPNPIAMTLIAAFVISAAYTRPHLAHRVLHGHDISYGVYIYHMVVVNFLVETRLLSGFAAIPVVFAITYAVAALSWTWIERPALRLKRAKLKVSSQMDVEPRGAALSGTNSLDTLETSGPRPLRR